MTTLIPWFCTVFFFGTLFGHLSEDSHYSYNPAPFIFSLVVCVGSWLVFLGSLLP
jgi:hypothetical protein